MTWVHLAGHAKVNIQWRELSALNRADDGREQGPLRAYAQSATRARLRIATCASASTRRYKVKVDGLWNDGALAEPEGRKVPRGCGPSVQEKEDLRRCHRDCELQNAAVIFLNSPTFEYDRAKTCSLLPTIGAVGQMKLRVHQ